MKKAFYRFLFLLMLLNPIFTWADVAPDPPSLGSTIAEKSNLIAYLIGGVGLIGILIFTVVIVKRRKK